MVTGKTHGYEFSIPEQRFDDMNLVEMLENVDNNPWLYGRIAVLLLGADGKKDLYNAIKVDDGRVPMSSLADCVADIFEAYGENGKNS